ncbi:hypothetical protein KGD82_13555 [Nocardiopsis eucommiae]|uniref:Scaffolding protein n=1 Tax=Nocardiopsis eucommiae TaxID=2831970 RepID=A0A975LCD8_9ACTN|nr:hypothetical protein KGD82_13555 [Nocardiopsis eucommiae]
MTEQQGQEPTAADPTEPTTDPSQQTDTTTPKEQGPEPKTFDEAYVKKLRDENAAQRVKAREEAEARTAAEERQQAQLDAIAQALGLKDADQPPTVDELTAQLTAAQQQAAERDAAYRQLTVERAAERAAREHGADVDTLLDSRSFAQKLSDLDPSAEDFADAVSGLVKQTVEDNPKYRLAQAAASSSADFSSGPGEQRKRTNSLHAAARSHYGVGG